MLLNYLSNALKFINKDQGKILILLQLIKPGDQKIYDVASLAFLKSRVFQFYRENIIETRLTSTEPIKEEEDPYILFKRGDTAKIVLSVFDNGVGIKEKDKQQLY